MDVDEYQDWTATTVIYTPKNEGDYLTAGLVGELGELFSAKAKYHRGDYESEECLGRIKAELGDIYWFLARICAFYGWSVSEVLEYNQAKLLGRQERGTLSGDGDGR